MLRIVELDRHLFAVGDEIGREVAAVELHALDHVELGGESLGLLDRDHAFLADLFHRLGDHVADVDCSPLAEMVPTWAILLDPSRPRS